MTLTAILRFLCTFIVVIVFASGVQDYVLAVGPVRIMPLHTPGMKGQYQVTGIGPRTFTTPDMTISRASKNQIIINYFLDGQWRKVRVPTAMWEDKVIWADPKKGVRFGEPAKHGSTDWINYDKLTFGGEKEKTRRPPKLPEVTTRRRLRNFNLSRPFSLLLSQLSVSASVDWDMS